MSRRYHRGRTKKVRGSAETLKSRYKKMCGPVTVIPKGTTDAARSDGDGDGHHPVQPEGDQENPAGEGASATTMGSLIGRCPCTYDDP